MSCWKCAHLSRAEPAQMAAIGTQVTGGAGCGLTWLPWAVAPVPALEFPVAACPRLPQGHGCDERDFSWELSAGFSGGSPSSPSQTHSSEWVLGLRWNYDRGGTLYTPLTQECEVYC